ncbi:sulfide-quinone reductase [Salinisphaera sp. PC39]|uniref:NAD(P)/FAD-dependent oxidoreductase n=1 Tax=Salinisphaera sp. PC39 TaxID=1304156 RepID=UPI00334020B2
MAHIVVVGAGIGGFSVAYELQAELEGGHEVTLVNPVPAFQFTPSNPWVALGWREPGRVQVPIAEHAARKGIRFRQGTVTGIDPAARRLDFDAGDPMNYDYLVIATGPELAFDEVPGLGPEAHSHSVCTTPHAVDAHEAYERFLKEPGPVVVGAVQGASCFGPAYEFALMLDTDLRRRRLRDKVPITFVTSEPYIGHMGLGGVGDSKGLLESELRQRHIRWVTSARVDEVAADEVRITPLDDEGEPKTPQTLPSRYTMFIPPFRGMPAWRGVEGLSNPRGFILVDDQQRNPAWQDIYATGVCIAIPPVEPTPVPTGAPKTGYMIESMNAAIVKNIAAAIDGDPVTAQATWNALCLADMGDSGFAFVAQPQIPPRNLTWSKSGKWVHWAKIAFEKYYLHKMRSGRTEPFYERYLLRLMGLVRLVGK